MDRSSYALLLPVAVLAAHGVAFGGAHALVPALFAIAGVAGWTLVSRRKKPAPTRAALLFAAATLGAEALVVRAVLAERAAGATSTTADGHASDRDLDTTTSGGSPSGAPSASGAAPPSAARTSDPRALPGVSGARAADAAVDAGAADAGDLAAEVRLFQGCVFECGKSRTPAQIHDDEAYGQRALARDRECTRTCSADPTCLRDCRAARPIGTSSVAPCVEGCQSTYPRWNQPLPGDLF